MSSFNAENALGPWRFVNAAPNARADSTSRSGPSRALLFWSQASDRGKKGSDCCGGEQVNNGRYQPRALQ